MARPSRSRGLSIFEVIALMAIVFGLVFGAIHGWDGGAWGAVWGAARGAFYAFASYFVGLFALLMLMSLGMRWRPFFPLCREGRCRDSDYRHLYLEQPAEGLHAELERAHHGKLVRCRCGTLYLDSERDRRFYEVTDDHRLLPYLRHSTFGRWQPDA